MSFPNRRRVVGVRKPWPYWFLPQGVAQSKWLPHAFRLPCPGVTPPPRLARPRCISDVKDGFSREGAPCYFVIR